jgi:uncharacterized protein
MNLPELGVGLNWLPGLESVIEGNAGLIDVLEVETQALRRRRVGDESTGPDSAPEKMFEIDRSAVAALQQRSVPKLVHSVNFPVGGTIAPASSELEPLSTVVRDLRANWISEHLAFNRVADESGSWNANLLLPPRQTLAGVDTALNSIRNLAACMPAPLAIETGVSYLRRLPDELPDGEFVARVAEAADCGILLDLHNVWSNDRNGRQSIGDYIEQLPLERVWEVHLSGGHFHRGFWLDSHTGTVPLDLLELAARIVPRLPSLKAIIFELVPSSLPRIGESAIRLQLEALHRLWDRRNTASIPDTPQRSEPTQRDPSPSPREWECTLAALAVHKPCRTALAVDLHLDPGLGVLREMVEQSRAAMIVHTLRLTSRLIMLERGTAYFEQLLAHFWRAHTPASSPLDEAGAFAAYLRDCNPYVPFLKEILDYDCAVLAVSADGEERSISFSADPMPLLAALGAGRRPAEIASGEFEIRLTPDQAGAQAMALPEISWMH